MRLCARRQRRFSFSCVSDYEPCDSRVHPFQHVQILIYDKCVRFTLLGKRGRRHPMSHGTAAAQNKSLRAVFQQLRARAPPSSYSRDPHDHLAVGVGGEAGFAGPDLTQDVQDGVAAVVVEDSPEPPNALIPPAATAQAVRIGARATCRRLTARTNRLPHVLGLFIVQYFPLLIDCLPALKDPVDR